MENLLEETLRALKDNGKSSNDVRFVISFPLFTDWKSFERNANFNYDDGYGWNYISLDLKIVGDNWWLERSEYDGSEWWDFKEIPDKVDIREANPHEIMKMIKS